MRSGPEALRRPLQADICTVQGLSVVQIFVFFFKKVYKSVKFEHKCGKLKMTFTQPVVEGELHRGQHTSHSKVAWTSGVPC